jgi:mono/diheme cytochrome c family protein
MIPGERAAAEAIKRLFGMAELRRGSALVVGVLVVEALSLCFAGMAGAQENLDKGKTGAQLYASDCAICHKTPQGLLKGGLVLGLDQFLREHYTASRESAVAISAYLQTVAKTPAPAAKRAAKKTNVKGDDADKPGNKKPASKAKRDDSKPSETKPSETKPSESKPPESKPPETKPSEAKAPSEPEPKAAEPKVSEPKPAETKPAESKPAESKPAESKPSETKPAESPKSD